MKRVIVCTAAGLAALLALWAFTPKAEYAPQGIILPAKSVRAPSEKTAIVIYHAAPANAQSLGQIRVEYAFETLNADVRDQLFDEIKSLAASVGANGVVIDLLAPGDGVRKVLTFVGTAVYVPKGAKK